MRTVGVALFGPNVSDRLSPSGEELPVGIVFLLGIFVSGRAHRNIGRVARTTFFEVMFRGEIIELLILLHPYRGMSHDS